MMKFNSKFIFAFFCSLVLFTTSQDLRAAESFIPLLKGQRPASDDLLYKGKTLTSREADSLSSKEKIDLTSLEPKPNDIWDTLIEHEVDDQAAIAIDDFDQLTFEGSILSNTGLYRFNAIPTNGNKIYTIHLDKTLHTLLLRKNLLRALGYKIPVMKYLREIQIVFDSRSAMDNFLKREIPEATLGAAERWATIDLSRKNQFVVKLKDVAISEPNEYDFYNVSMGIPTQTINSRTLRSLVIPYSLVDLYESVNKFSWVAGKIDNKAVVLPHFTNNEFATTIEDSLWMLKRLNQLTRSDFQRIVEQSFFPKEVEAVLIEKIISRRNSLNRLFSINEKDLNVNTKISVGAYLKEGKLLVKEYPEYASRFAYGDAESPLEQLRFFLYSKIQSNLIDNLVNKINGELMAFDIGEKRADYFKKQFQTGLEHFIETGEILPIKVGTWYSPTLSVNLILSRDIVLGNYLGTDNLVQLADTFGASANIGLFVGVEGLGYDLSGSAKVGTSLVRSYSHLKPVKNLKTSLKEPYKNLFVSLLKKSLKEKFFTLSELQTMAIGEEGADSTAKEERRKLIEETLKEIAQKLDVGESLILTDRLMPTTDIRLNFSQGLIGAGIGVSSGMTILKRIHFYRKSSKILQIYDDVGAVKSIDLSFQLSNHISLLKVNAGIEKGNYRVNSYMVNLSSDDSENPNFFTNALGVHNVLKNKDFEILSKSNPPVKLNVNFKDKIKGLSLLFWKVKSLNGKTYYDIKARDGVKGTYFSYEKDFLTGLNPEEFSKQLVNYYLSRNEIEEFQLSVDGNANPGESFLGRSHTQKIRFEASVDEQKRHGQKFLSLSDIKQGWSMSEQKIKKFMEKVNSKFQYPLFNLGVVDFKKLRLFQMGYHLNLYERGIERLLNLDGEEIKQIEARYTLQKACSPEDAKFRTAECGDLNWIKYLLKQCKKAKSDEEVAECSVKLFERALNDLEFADFKRLIGEDNLYIYGSIDGFREKSEILNDTIYSNSIGKIGSKQWNGPLEVVRELLGLSAGEFSGGWIREGL